MRKKYDEENGVEDELRKVQVVQEEEEAEAEIEIHLSLR